MKLLGRALRQRAQELGLSDKEVAQRAGLEQGRYGNYARGEREPDIATLLRICEALSTTPNHILGVSTDGPPEATTIVVALNAMSDHGRSLAVQMVQALATHHPRGE